MLALMRFIACGGAAGGMLMAAGLGVGSATEPWKDVDAAIVLASDTSQSIDKATAQRQKWGHIAALQSDDVIDAINYGPRGCIAVSYFEWAGTGRFQSVLQWTMICDRKDAVAAGQIIEKRAFSGESRRAGGRGTSLSHAIDASVILLDRLPVHATRKVIDVSANGINNDGGSVAFARKRALDRGYIINGIVLARSEPGMEPDLPGYFVRNVIGGPGSFVIVPARAEDYAQAILRKLVVEIAGAWSRRSDTNPRHRFGYSVR